jgi:hypothetical protein
MTAQALPTVAALHIVFEADFMKDPVLAGRLRSTRARIATP